MSDRCSAVSEDYFGHVDFEELGRSPGRQLISTSVTMCEISAAFGSHTDTLFFVDKVNRHLHLQRTVCAYAQKVDVLDPYRWPDAAADRAPQPAGLYHSFSCR